MVNSRPFIVFVILGGIIVLLSIGALVGSEIESAALGQRIVSLESQLKLERARVEELSGFQTTVSILTGDLEECRDDLDVEKDFYDERAQELFDCQESLVYCRKVCGELE